MSNDIVYIYALCDPDTGMVRYIGKTNDLKRRYRDHIAEKRKSYKANWIESLKKCNKLPIIKIIEEVSINNWQEAEKKWVKYYNTLYTNLTNGTDGGEGINKHTIESRAKITQALKGHKGVKFSKESKEKISNALKIVMSDPIRRKKQSENGKIQMSDPERKQKAANACNKLWANPEFRKRRTEEVKKQWTNPEFKAIRTKAVKKQWADPEFRKAQIKKGETYKQTELTRKKRGETHKNLWKDLNFRARMMALRHKPQRLINDT